VGLTLGELIFWTALVIIAYVYFGYPLVAALRAKLRSRPRVRGPIEPSVSILVIANNEAHRIAARIENLLDLDYPADRLEVIVASDGSTDDTVDIANRYADRGVTVRTFTTRRGKSAVLNAVVPGLKSEIVLFADARQTFARNALRAIVENFADAKVGAVSGELVLTTGAGTAAAGCGTAFYWRYEKFIRSAEARGDSTVGATGAIYAIRRELFEKIPDDTILDDVLIPLRIVRQGYRVLFEAGARAYDSASATAQHEFVRKARTIAGTFQVLSRERWLFNPRENRLWFETMSHKALRLTLPILHLAVLAASGALADQWLYRVLFVGQLMFYAGGVIGHLQRSEPRRSVVFSVPCAICLLSWATIVGFTRFLTNRQQATWERVASSSVSPS
jgi:cellulose synthase/poly-beta-1,6-N-acetylglucosamine synthase-like glycosyltransferase